MLTTQACSQVVIGHLFGGLKPTCIFQNDNAVFIVNIYVFVDAALAKLHRAAMNAKISMEATC